MKQLAKWCFISAAISLPSCVVFVSLTGIDGAITGVVFAFAGLLITAPKILGGIS